MSNSDFLKKGNISMLWDVISDEEIFKFLPKETQENVAQLFINNISGFFEVERKKSTGLIEINKKYIILILNHIKTNFPKKTHNKIKILDDIPVKEVITYEEIHNERKSQFEKDLAKRQEEFTNSITLKVPDVPEFADKHVETPISEMDKIIKEMTAQRNYEVEQINRSYQSDINSSSNWLTPQETSIKAEKGSPQNDQDKNREEKTQNQNYSKSKYLQTFNEVVDSPSKKNVSWGENREIEDSSFENAMETNIFQKLKRVGKEQKQGQKQGQGQEKQEQNNISLTIEENTYNTRIYNLETEIKLLNNKLDTIISLLHEKQTN